jgi:hypothetical protein
VPVVLNHEFRAPLFVEGATETHGTGTTQKIARPKTNHSGGSENLRNKRGKQMKTLSTMTQAIRKVKATHIITGTGSTVLFGLALIIIFELVRHGQTALGAYMLLSQLMEKFHKHTGQNNEAVEHVVHITAHGTELH